MPFPVTMEVLERGQERYNIYCTPCHSRVGNGAGMIVERGYRPAGNFHTQRLMAAPLGHFFNVMTNGYGAMPDYEAQVAPVDRWAIVAYIKALQLSQDAKPADAAPGAQIQSLDDIAAERRPASRICQRLGACRRRRMCTAPRTTRTTASPRRSTANAKGAHCSRRRRTSNVTGFNYFFSRPKTNVICTRTTRRTRRTTGRGCCRRRWPRPQRC